MKASQIVLKKLESKNPKQCSYLPCASIIFLAVILRWSMRNLTGVSRKLHLYDCYMDPIMQKTGLTPDQKLRKANV